MNIKAAHLQQPRKRREHPTVLVRFQKTAKIRKLYVAQIPGWRRPLAGYVMSIPIVALGCLAAYLEFMWLTDLYFFGIPIIIAIMFVALIWGLGPALFSVLLGSVALGVMLVTPYGIPNAIVQDKLLSLVPFIVAGFIVAIITGQREAARLRALTAEQDAIERAEELEQANQDLEKADQLKDRFLSMAAHELKTPITSISGLAQVTRHRLRKSPDGSIDASNLQTTLEKIENQAQRLNTLVNDLLDLSNIQSGHIPLQISTCDITAICRDVTSSQSQLTGRWIELQAPDAPIKVKADNDRLEQVITNLVSNALKYSPEDTPVQVTAGLRDRSVSIAVRDHGQGISKEQLPHIFEAFYRAPDARTSKKRGWGLGLAICKDIVERHGGTIWCESKVGEGSTFYVELPLK